MPKVTESGRAASGPVSLASSPVVALLCNPLKAGVGHLFIPDHHATLSVHRESWSHATGTSGVQSEAHSLIERTLLVTHIQHVLGTNMFPVYFVQWRNTFLCPGYLANRGQWPVSPIALCGFVWLNYEPPKQTRPLTLLCVSTTKHRRGPSVSSYPLYGSSYPGGTVIKNQPHNTADARDMDSILGLGRSPGVGNGNPFLYSCLENPMDRGAWWTTVLGVAKGGDSRCLQGHDWATGHTQA